MITRALYARLEGEIRIVKIDRLRGTVTLDIEGDMATYKVGDKAVLSLEGKFNK